MMVHTCGSQDGEEEDGEDDEEEEEDEDGYILSMDMGNKMKYTLIRFGTFLLPPICTQPRVII